jgi:hypothetical protein
MKCIHCKETVRGSKEKYNERLKMCTGCYKAWKKIGKNLKKVVY